MKDTTENNQDEDRSLRSSAAVKHNPLNVTTEATRKIKDAGTSSEDLAVGGDNHICSHSEQLKQVTEQLRQANAFIEKQESEIARFDILLQQWELDIKTTREGVRRKMGRKDWSHKQQVEGQPAAKRQKTTFIPFTATPIAGVDASYTMRDPTWPKDWDSTWVLGSKWHQDSWPRQLDGPMWEQISNMSDKIRVLCEKYAIKEFDGLFLRERFAAGEEDIKEILTQELWPALASRKTKLHNKTFADMVLRAWLHWYICDEVVSSPFHFMEELEPDDLPKAGTDLRLMFQKLLDVHGEDSTQVHIARSELLRLYEYPDTGYPHFRVPVPQHRKDISEEANQLRSAVTQSKLAVHKRLASEFLNRAQKLIVVKPEEEERVHARIVEAMQMGARLAAALGTSKCGLVCLGLSDLPKTFDHTSLEMEEWSGHMGDTFDDPGALDGKPILMVMQPAIVAIGSQDDFHNNCRRVIHKAIVFLG